MTISPRAFPPSFSPSPSVPPPPPPLPQMLCHLRQDIELHAGPRDASGAPSWTLLDPSSKQFFRIDWRVFEILSRWNCGRVAQNTDSPDADAAATVAKSVNAHTTLTIDADDVREVDTFLRRNFLSVPEFTDRQRHVDARKSMSISPHKLLQSYLFLKIPLCRPDAFLAAILPFFRIIYTRGFLLGIGLASLLSFYLIARQWDTFLASLPQFFRMEGLLIYALALLFSKSVHELAHALTLKHFGLHVPTLGVALLVFWPLLYTDATDSWKCASKHRRLAIAAAGILAELGLAAVAGIAWTLLDDGPWRSACFVLATTNWISTIVFNMNPFMRFDGYFILSDITGMENLQERAFALLRWHTARLFFTDHAPPPERFSPAKTAWILAYAVCVFLYRITIIVSLSLLVYYFFFKALGILLFIVQIRQSVLLPLKRAGGTLWKNRKAARPFACIVLALAMVALCMGIVLPTNSTIRTQAVLSAAHKSYIHVPESGQLDFALPKAQNQVEAGEALYHIKSPHLTQDATVAEIRLKRLQQQISTLGFTPEQQEERLVLMAEWQETQGHLATTMEQIAHLRLTSPLSGRFERPVEAPHTSDWVQKGETLAVVVDTQSPRLVAYISEIDLARMQLGASATFYPMQTESHPLHAHVSSIATHAANYVDDAFFASRFGGVVPTSEAHDGRMQAIKTFYRVEFSLAEGRLPMTTELDGTVSITAPAQSLLLQFWRKVQSVFIRESVF